MLNSILCVGSGIVKAHHIALCCIDNNRVLILGISKISQTEEQYGK